MQNPTQNRTTLHYSVAPVAHALCLLLAAIFVAACGVAEPGTGAQDPGTMQRTNGSDPLASATFHIVSFRFKSDDPTRAMVPAALAAFEALRDSVVDPADGRRLITGLYDGVNNSTEQLSFGTKGVAKDRSTEFTFVLTFRSVADRDYYVDHDPEHAKFKQLVGPLLEGGAEGVFVTDFVNGVKGPAR